MNIGTLRQEEIWKDIKGYEGLYQVSNLGNIKSLDRFVVYSGGELKLHKSKNIKQNPNQQGYLTMTLSKNNCKKSFRVNRLVAETFIPNPLNLPQVNHKDENKLNNNVENLEWCTAKYNCNYGNRGIKISSKIDYKKIAEINKLKQSKKVFQYDLNNNLLKVWKSVSDCTKEGFSSSGISQCCHNKLNTYKGFIWTYLRLGGEKIGS